MSLLGKVIGAPLRLCRQTLLSILSALYNCAFFQNKNLRKLAFRLSKPNIFLVSNNAHETFIVSSSDKTIGKSVFVEEAPFDFDKFELALNLLGANHKRVLLIDIGANIGTICIAAVKRGYFQHAIAIEPEPLNYALLQANIAINRLGEKITTHNIALGQNDDESLIFELCEDNYGDHRIKSLQNTTTNEAPRSNITIKSETFNKIIGDIKPDETLIWIDTQGYEGYVFAGASKALSKKTPICLEFWPYALSRCGCYNLLKDALVKNGYEFFYDLENPHTQMPLTESTLDALYGNLEQQERFTDLLVY